MQSFFGAFMPETTTWPSLSLYDVYRALSAQRKKAALCFLVITVSAAVLTLLWPRTYRSEGKLLVRLGRENAMLDATATLGQDAVVAVPWTRENEINSHVEILQSRPVLEKVVDALGPAQVLYPGQEPLAATAADHPGWFRRGIRLVGGALAAMNPWPRRWGSGAALSDRERAVALLAEELRVWVPRKSNVVQIAYDSSTAESAQAVVAAVLRVYPAEHARLNRPEGSFRFFSEQAAQLRKELAAKEAALRDLKTATGLAAPEQQLQVLVARAGRLQDDLLEAEAAQSVAEAKVQRLRLQLVDLPPTRVVDRIAGLGDEGTDRMREQLYVLQLKREDARSRYTDIHPKMRQLEEQIVEAQQLLDRQPATRTQVTTTTNRFHDDVRGGLLEAEPLLASLGAKTGVLRRQLAEVSGQLQTLNRDQLRIALLARDVELCQADYRKYAASVEQSRIDEALASERMSNLSVVQPASYEARPLRPQKALNLVLGLLLGALGGVAVAVVADGRDRRLRAPSDLETKLGLAVLGAIPQLRARELALHVSKRR
jgi:uncharacterized protein involved in exopolysaccharide biosynthesis